MGIGLIGEILIVAVAIYLVIKYRNMWPGGRGMKSEVGAGAQTPATENEISAYTRKPYLFDSVPEYRVFQMLLDMYGSDYHIFHHINYSHIVKPKKAHWSEMRQHRSRIDRKSADFVLCDKERCVPQLVIELDGNSHQQEHRKARDEFIDQVLAEAGIPIVHVHPKEATVENIRKVVDDALAK